MTAQLDPSQAKQLPRSVPAQLKCGWEQPSAIAREIDGLARRFAAELGQPPYDPDWERIFALERASLAAVWTARTHSGFLAGYFGCTINVGLFTGRRYTRIEAGYLAPEWRSGSMGLRFIKSVVAAIEGPIEWETNDAFQPDADGRSRLALLLEKLGFEQVGTVMRLAK